MMMIEIVLIATLALYQKYNWEGQNPSPFQMRKEKHRIAVFNVDGKYYAISNTCIYTKEEIV